jgi:hypothetical protein
MTVAADVSNAEDMGGDCLVDVDGEASSMGWLPWWRSVLWRRAGVSSTAQEGHGGGGLRDGGLWRNFDPGWRASATMA